MSCPPVSDDTFIVKPLHCLLGESGVRSLAGIFGGIQVFWLIWVLRRFLQRYAAGKITRSWADLLYVSQMVFSTLTIIWCIFLLADPTRFWSFPFCLAVFANGPQTNSLLTVWAALLRDKHNARQSYAASRSTLFRAFLVYQPLAHSLVAILPSISNEWFSDTSFMYFGSSHSRFNLYTLVMLVAGTCGFSAVILMYRVMMGVLHDIKPLAGNPKVDSLLKLTKAGLYLLIPASIALDSAIWICSLLFPSWILFLNMILLLVMFGGGETFMVCWLLSLDASAVKEKPNKIMPQPQHGSSDAPHSPSPPGKHHSKPGDASSLGSSSDASSGTDRKQNGGLHISSNGSKHANKNNNNNGGGGDTLVSPTGSTAGPTLWSPRDGSAAVVVVAPSAAASAAAATESVEVSTLPPPSQVTIITAQ